MAITETSSGPKVGQYFYNLEGYPGLTSSSNVNIYEEMVGENEQWLKIGIQAPAGTQVEINHQTVTVGRTGIYELDDNIVINNLNFVQPTSYKYDEEASNEAIAHGLEIMNQAKEDLNNAGDDIEAEKAAVDSYIEGYNEYRRGVNGIYTEDGLSDLKNIIIDYVYLEQTTSIEEV